jgi:CBS domain-containing protein
MMTNVLTRMLVKGNLTYADRAIPADPLAGDVAHRRPVTVEADASTEIGMHLMAKHKIRRLPVMDDGRCIGMISQADIARTMPPEGTGKMVGVISTE